jgi:hypothetical protein
MSRNDEFAAGHNRVSMLGVTGNIYPTRNQAALQSIADDYWGKDQPKAGQTISEQGAKDLIGETIHHPAMDAIPGIADIRRNFNPNTQVQLDDELPKGIKGHLETLIGGQQTMRLGHTPEEPLRTNVVTHETAHLLSHPTLEHIQWNNFDNANAVGHSWAMARTHIYAVRAALGNEAADALRSIYRAHGISFGRRNI